MAPTCVVGDGAQQLPYFRITYAHLGILHFGDEGPMDSHCMDLAEPKSCRQPVRIAFHTVARAYGAMPLCSRTGTRTQTHLSA